MPAPGSRGGAPRLGLRRRILLTFTLGSMTLSAFLAVHHVRVHPLERGPAARRDSVDAAGLTRRRAQALLARQLALTRGRRSSGARRARRPARADLVRRCRVAGRRRTSFPIDAPAELLDRVDRRQVPARMTVHVGERTEHRRRHARSRPTAPTSSSSASTRSTARSRSVRLSLLFAAVITTGLGVAARRRSPPGAPCGRWPSPPRRPRRSPVAGSTPASNRPTTPTCSVLANSFNDMASALQQRVERDARFASDVSHELRSPLMTLAASVEVMEARRDEMPERAQAALDLLSGDVDAVPGPRRGPARDQPLRRRRDPTAPRGAAASPSSSARRSPSAACPTRRSR